LKQVMALRLHGRAPTWAVPLLYLFAIVEIVPFRDQ